MSALLSGVVGSSFLPFQARFHYLSSHICMCFFSGALSLSFFSYNRVLQILHFREEGGGVGLGWKGMGVTDKGLGGKSRESHRS